MNSTQRARGLAGRLSLVVAIAALLLPGTSVAQSGVEVAAAVQRELNALRVQRGAPLLQRQGELDRFAALRAGEVAEAPLPKRGMVGGNPQRRLKEKGYGPFSEAHEQVTMLSGYLRLESRALKALNSDLSFIEQAMRPEVNQLGIGTATSQDGYFMLVTVVAAGQLATPPPTRDPAALAQQVLDSVNFAREAEGLAPLALEPALSRLAQQRSEQRARGEQPAPLATEPGAAREELEAQIGAFDRLFEVHTQVPAETAAARTVLKLWVQSAEVLRDPKLTHLGYGTTQLPDGRRGPTVLLVERP